jgi:hypothetical protein
MKKAGDIFLERDNNRVILMDIVNNKNSIFRHEDYSHYLRSKYRSITRQNLEDDSSEYVEHINSIDDMTVSMLNKRHDFDSSYLKHEKDAEGITIDQLNAEILAYKGVRPEVFSAIKKVLENKNETICIEDPDYQSSFFIPVSRAVTGDYQSITLGESVYWSLLGILEIMNVPDTIQSSLPGLPLKNFFSHPVFDKYDLEIPQNMTAVKSTVIITLEDGPWKKLIGFDEMVDISKKVEKKLAYGN